MGVATGAHTDAFFTGCEHLAPWPAGFSSSHEESSGDKEDGGEEAMVFMSEYSGIFEERLSVLCSLCSS